MSIRYKILQKTMFHSVSAISFSFFFANSLEYAHFTAEVRSVSDILRQLLTIIH